MQQQDQRSGRIEAFLALAGSLAVYGYLQPTASALAAEPQPSGDPQLQVGDLVITRSHTNALTKMTCYPHAEGCRCSKARACSKNAASAHCSVHVSEIMLGLGVTSEQISCCGNRSNASQVAVNANPQAAAGAAAAPDLYAIPKATTGVPKVVPASSITSMPTLPRLMVYLQHLTRPQCTPLSLQGAECASAWMQEVILYQYDVCPFCCKVKAVLDYYRVRLCLPARPECIQAVLSCTPTSHGGRTQCDLASCRYRTDAWRWGH